MAKVVIDANVLISAVFGGNPLEAVSRAFTEHEVLLSESILEELKGVFKKLARKLSAEQMFYLQEIVNQLAGKAHRVRVATRVTLSRDPKDDYYLSLCKEGGADYLITGDKDLLNIAAEVLRKHGIICRTITSKSFLEIESPS